MKNHKIIYSTDNSYSEEKDGELKIELDNLEQNIRLYLDRKKGGKITTVIKGFSFFIES